jgi:hypothetical protein
VGVGVGVGFVDGRGMEVRALEVFESIYVIRCPRVMHQTQI